MTNYRDNPALPHERLRMLKAFQQLQAQRKRDALAQRITANPLLWLQRYTKTKDSHWRESGAQSPYNPFPEKPYFRPLAEFFHQEPVLFIEKSRDMMISWLCVGLFTHVCMTRPGTDVLFQSQKEEKAFALVDYAKCLYDHQSPLLKQIFPLAAGIQCAGEILFANGSRILGIPGGKDQVRSYHPWGLLQDEAAFMPEAGNCYDHAVPACHKIVVVSSIAPGWFAAQCQNARHSTISGLPRGVSLKRISGDRLVVRIHYSADPDRDPAIHPEWRPRERQKYSTQGAWDREQEITYGA